MAIRQGWGSRLSEFKKFVLFGVSFSVFFWNESSAAENTVRVYGKHLFRMT